MRALVLGASGQVGTALSRLSPDRVQVTARNSAEVDLNDLASLPRAVRNASPDVLINCAAFTNVDAAEQLREQVMRVNARAPEVLAQTCEKIGCRFVHISSDFVFDGTATRPYKSDDPVAPLNVYGESKALAERLVTAINGNSVIVRTSWVYSCHPGNFIRTAAEWLSEGKAMHVVSDQVRSPTCATDLAGALWALACRPETRGVVHFTDRGAASRHEVTVAVAEELRRLGRLHKEGIVSPISTKELKFLAPRPMYSVLENWPDWEKIGVIASDWRSRIAETVRQVIHA